MLSNTAVPKYYREFRAAVMRGEIPVNREISMEMNRIDDLIANPGVWYDEEAVEGFIKFCNNELTLVDGSDLELLDTFKLWAEQLFGWYYFIEKKVFKPGKNGQRGRRVRKVVKKRLINFQYLIIGRSAAKTIYLMCVQAYFLVVDGSTTNQITTSPTMKQSDEVLGPLRTAITRARGPLFKFLTEGSLQNTVGSPSKRVKLFSSKKGIENRLTNSLLTVLPLSIDKLQGYRTKVSTLDEWLSGELRENPITAIAQNSAKIKDFVVVAASSEGTVRNGCGDEIKMELMDILKGDYINQHVSIFYYRLDDINEIADPNMWIKANPNLGITVEWEVYQQEVEKAEAVPSSKNEIIAKRFGIPAEGKSYFFLTEEIKPHRKRSYNGMLCALGADLSQGNDFCAFSFLFPLQNGFFGVKVRSYITSNTYEHLTRTQKQKYDQFINEGTLIVFDGVILDTDNVYDDLDAYIEEMGYDVCCFGYDPYNAKDFVDRWEREHGSYGVNKVIQGIKTESVPLGELKNLAHSRMLLFDEELMSFTMGNCIVLEDSNGNRKLWKKRYEDKIDNVASTMDAFVSYKLNKESFR